MAIEHSQIMTVEEYFQLEESDPGTHYEYVDGHVYAMVGGTANHDTIKPNMQRILWSLLRGSTCRVYSSDMKVFISETRYFHHDVIVTCGPRDRGTVQAIQSPRLVVEVLSPSTELIDRTWKLQNYRTHPTVSRVLNQRPDVSAETRERVLRVIAERGYVSNRVPQVTKRAETKLIELVITTPLDSEYYLEIIRGVDETLNQTGRRLVLSVTYNDTRLVQDWNEHLVERSPEGVLLIAIREQFDYITALQKAALPFVVIDDSMTFQPDIPSVGATNWGGGLSATEYLLSWASPHRRNQW